MENLLWDSQDKLVEKTDLQISDKARQSSVGVKQVNKFYVKGPLK